MRRTRVSSSAVSSLGYDERQSVLEVEFRSGAVYDYFDVPPKVWKELQKAPSKGQFVSQRIRDQYPFVRR